MKLQSNTSIVEISGGGAQGSFGIKQSPKAFQILSSGLYTNKPMAIVRELSANASDAHVLNGNQKTAFEVKLPNRLDNQFYIKDFGPGLTHEQVMKLYTTYFESTKAESNDFIGGLGLGSKSPFSYTDAFTVESRQNGVKRTYSAFVAENGVPQIVQLGENIPTNEPDGLTVGFPVQPNDYETFRKEAQRILPWFEPMPKVVGATITPKDAPVQSFDDLEMYDRIPIWVENSWSKETFVRMGNVIYPLDWDASGLSDDKDIQTILNNHSRSSTLVFTIPIGSVEVAASREGLQYDRGSKASLKALSERLMAQLGGILEKEVKEILEKHTPFEANARVSALENHWGFTFKEATRIFEKKGLNYPALKTASEIRFPTTNPKHLDVLYMPNGSRTAAEVMDGRILTSNGSVPLSFIPNQSYLVVEANTRGVIAAAKALTKEKPKEDYFKGHRTYNAAVIIRPKNPKDADKPEYIAERDAFLKAVGSPPTVKSSEYTPPARASFGSKTTPGVQVAKEEFEAYVLNSNAYRRDRLGKEVVDAKDITAWTAIDGTSLYCSSAKGTHSENPATLHTAFTIVRDAAEKAGLPDVPTKLHGIPGKYKARIQILDAKKNVWDWMVETLKNPLVRQALSKGNSKIEYSNTSDWSDRRNAEEFVSGIAQHQDLFKKLGAGWALLISSDRNEAPSQRLLDLMGGFFKDNQTKLEELKPQHIEGTKTYVEFFKKMPMLALAIRELSDNKNKELLKEVKDFIESKPVQDLAVFTNNA